MRICSARMKKDLCILAAHLGMRPLPPKTRKNVHRNAPLLFPYLHFFLPGVNSDALGYGNLTYLSQKNNPTGDASFPFDQASKNRSRIWNGSRDIDNRICDGNDREVWCFVQCKLPPPTKKSRKWPDFYIMILHAHLGRWIPSSSFPSFFREAVKMGFWLENYEEKRGLGSRPNLNLSLYSRSFQIAFPSTIVIATKLRKPTHPSSNSIFPLKRFLLKYGT